MYYAIAFCMGLAIALQAPINAALARSLGGSVLVSAFISFFVGTACLAVFAYFGGALHLEVLKALPQQAWWKFLGGILGAFFVFGTILLAPKIGLINMIVTVLIAQLVAGLILDSVGAFGMSIKPIYWQKIVGLVVICLGLLVFFSKELNIIKG